MATEPERPIEKLLQAWAKKRRDEAAGGPGLELHPATRRLLQAEVTRRYGRGGARTGWFFRGLMALRSRLVEGLVIIALVAGMGTLLLPELAKSKSKATVAMKGQQAPGQPLSAALREPLQPPVTNLPRGEHETGQTLIAAADKELMQRDQAGAFGKAKEEETGKDRALISSGIGPQETPATITLAESSSSLAGANFTPGSPPTPLAAAPAPAGNPMVARSSYGVPGQSRGRAGAPAAAPALAVPPAVDATIASAEKKPSMGLADLAKESNGQVGLGYKALDEDALRRAAAMSNEARQSSGALVAGKSQGTDGLAANRSLAFQQGARVPSGGGGAAPIVQRYLWVEPALGGQKAPANKPAHSVLVSFQVEQAGQNLRVVDSDGSVYSGLLQVADAATRQRPDQPDSRAKTVDNLALKLESAPPVQGLGMPERAYFFRVAGTNRSLKQRVVFTGSLVGSTNAALYVPMTGGMGGGSGDLRSAPAPASTAPLLNTRILGKVVIGNGKAVEINAVPAVGGPQGK